LSATVLPASNLQENCDGSPRSLWSELSRHSSSTEKTITDHPLKALDWSAWLSPNLDKWIGQGSYGDVFIGSWRDVPPKMKMPTVVTKRMRCHELEEQSAKLRYRVRWWFLISMKGITQADISNRISNAKSQYGKSYATRILCPSMVFASAQGTFPLLSQGG
jgi:hypothetical protein